MAYPAIAVANYFVGLSREESRQAWYELDYLKLSKLVYIAHGWHLALCDLPLIKERVLVRSYGVLIEPVYREYRGYINKQIKKCSSKKEKINYNDHKVQAILNKIWKEYGNFTGIQLLNLTHVENTPCKRAIEEMKGFKGYSDYAIDDEEIKRYYRNLINEPARLSLVPPIS